MLSFSVLCLAAASSARAQDAEKGVLVPIPIFLPCQAAFGCQVVDPTAPGCDNATVAEALTRTPLSEIRVVAGTSTENVAIADRTLLVTGGFASCAAARAGTAPEATSTLQAADAGQPVLVVTASGSSDRLVQLNRLAITGVDGAAQGALRIAGPAGGGRVSPLRVSMTGSRVHGNVATLGGGVWLRDAQLSLVESRIEGNEALQRGGGVHCLAGTVELASLRSAVADNLALTGGGGLYLDDCTLAVRGGSDNAIPFAERGGVRNNVATLGSGGGIHATGASDVTLGREVDDLQRSVELVGNRANALDGGGGLGGGGLYLAGGSHALVTNTLIADNRAGSDTPADAAPASVGGGIAVTGGSRLETTRPGNCLRNWVFGHYDGLCTRISENVASGAGGALYAHGSYVFLEFAMVANNRSGDGGVVDVTASLYTTVDTVLLGRNRHFSGPRGAKYAVQVTSGNALVRSSTITDNENSLASIGQGIANVEIRAVLIDDIEPPLPPALMFDSSAPPQVFCLHAHEAASFPATAVNSRVADPGWSLEQRNTFDVHLVADGTTRSPMIDACSFAQAEGPWGLFADADREARGYTRGIIPIDAGPVDVGLDEYVPMALFADGFETPLAR